jgi:mRNA-degrading endonuclease toxin of MazEF toxin-antitoxin module
VRLIHAGDIVWVRMVDPNGVNEKVRPVVVLTSSGEISAGSPVVGATVTTTLPTPLTDDYVELPWQPQGKVKTGLKRRCAVLCTWLVPIDPDQIEEIRGRVPAHKLIEIKSKTIALQKRAESESNGDGPRS